MQRCGLLGARPASSVIFCVATGAGDGAAMKTANPAARIAVRNVMVTVLARGAGRRNSGMNRTAQPRMGGARTLVATELGRRIGGLLGADRQVPVPATTCDHARIAIRRGQARLVYDLCPVEPSFPADAMRKRYFERARLA